MTTKVNNRTAFITNLNTILNVYSSTEIKEAIGDSTNNNRVPTASQFGRFLLKSRKYKSFARQYAVVYSALRNDMKSNRTTSRSDAFDINEFTETLEIVNLYAPRDLTNILRTA